MDKVGDSAIALPQQLIAIDSVNPGLAWSCRRAGDRRLSEDPAI
jgi:hypothetical protein